MGFPFSARTDLASEAHRLAAGEALGELPGIEAEERRAEGFSLCRVRVLDERGERLLGKPRGRYVTLEPDRIPGCGEEGFAPLARALAEEIRGALGFHPDSALVAALGNEAVTPDALGPSSACWVFPTRHLVGQPAFSGFLPVSVCRPGVLGSSGIESAAQIRALLRETGAACVIAVDALAGADPTRLCRSLQITDAGIAPGSGVGNDRARLCRDSLGVPVVAVGMPTVIDAAALGAEPGLQRLFVTPRDIDAAIRDAGRLIGCAVDLALYPDIRVEDVFALVD